VNVVGLTSSLRRLSRWDEDRAELATLHSIAAGRSKGERLGRTDEQCGAMSERGKFWVSEMWATRTHEDVGRDQAPAPSGARVSAAEACSNVHVGTAAGSRGRLRCHHPS
jgi:hypothetical protein